MISIKTHTSNIPIMRNTVIIQITAHIITKSYHTINDDDIQ